MFHPQVLSAYQQGEGCGSSEIQVTPAGGAVGTLPQRLTCLPSVVLRETGKGETGEEEAGNAAGLVPREAWGSLLRPGAALSRSQ